MRILGQFSELSAVSPSPCQTMIVTSDYTEWGWVRLIQQGSLLCCCGCLIGGCSKEEKEMDNGVEMKIEMASRKWMRSHSQQ